MKKLFLFISIFLFLHAGCKDNKESRDNSRLLMEKLTYRGLSLETSKDRLLKQLGQPDFVEDKSALMPDQEGGFGREVEYQLYTYQIGGGIISFSVYQDSAVVYQILFDDDSIVLEYEYDLVKLSNKVSFEKAKKLFSAVEGSETPLDKGEKINVLIFQTNSKSGMAAYKTPQLRFQKGFLISLFYYPEF